MVKRRKRYDPYRPVDGILDNWRVKILRAARRFDWFEPCDLVDALDVPGSDEDLQERNSFQVMLSRLARTGLLERRGEPMAYWYRITIAGRRDYERQMRRAVA